MFIYVIVRTFPSPTKNPSPQVSVTTGPTSPPSKGTFSKAISPAQAWDHVGQTETVRYYVSYTGSSSAGTEFLDQYQNYTSGFITTIFANDVPSWPNDPGITYLDHTIIVTGTISVYNGYVEIIAYTPSQILAVN